MLRQVLTRGNLLYWNNFRAQLVRVKTSMCMQVDASDLDFVGYMTQPQMKEADK